MSLQSTYQSVKNIIASNLTTKGVSANGSEGLTTLANKINDISSSSDYLPINAATALNYGYNLGIITRDNVPCLSHSDGNGNNSGYNRLRFKVPSNWQLEFKYYQGYSWQWETIYSFNDDTAVTKLFNLSASYDSSGGLINVANMARNSWNDIKITMSSGTLTLYVDGTSKGSVSYNSTYNQIRFGGNSTTYYKDIKLKSL